MIELITLLLPIAESLGKVIVRSIEKARQEGELTPEKEAEFQARLDSVFSQPYAQPRPSGKVGQPE